MLARTKKENPSQGKARRSTRDRLLDMAGILLSEVGVERISTNMICERAGVTPPALYYYFADKYEILVALGERLMERQNEALMRWLARHAGGGIDAYAASLEELLRETAEITEAEPGGIWIERALHATPRLDHVRIESHRIVTETLTEAFAPSLPDIPRDVIWHRVRMLIEFGYVATELLHAGSGLDRDRVLAETARMQQLAIRDLQR